MTVFYRNAVAGGKVAAFIKHVETLEHNSLFRGLAESLWWGEEGEELFHWEVKNVVDPVRLGV